MKTFNRIIKKGGEVKKVGTNPVRVLDVDIDNNVLLATGATVPPDADAGFAVGCRFIDTDGGLGTTVYINEGTAASAKFRRIGGTVAASDLTAASTLTPADSGKVLFLNSTTEFATTLPSPAAGLRFTFIVKAAPSGASYTILSASSANIIKGQVYTVDVNSATDPDFEVSGGDTISLVDSKAIAGDRVELFCDGTNWFMYGFCSVFDAITITTAS